ncbi:MAG: DUF2269 domain-containing protein [Comamonadaceae bacterium]|nr:DUF2269 domain-containing protein [Comamonadaceae bacterium]
MVLLLGTGLGSARSTNGWPIAAETFSTSRSPMRMVLADWCFTTPMVIFQPISVAMAMMAGVPLTTPWIAASLALYCLAGACWLPVVWLQIRMQKLAEAALDGNTTLPGRYWWLARVGSGSASRPSPQWYWRSGAVDSVCSRLFNSSNT